MVEVFGKDVLNKKPYIALYDEKNEVWLVEGSLPEAPPGHIVVGSVQYVLIRRSGEVIAVWHDKWL